MSPHEVPLEQTQEELVHRAESAVERWIMNVALTAAILAVLAAVTALMAEHHATHAMIEQLGASDHWSYYQAKSIKANLLKSKLDMLSAVGKTPSKEDIEKLAEYDREQKEIMEKAKEKETESKMHLHAHTVLSSGVTMFQVAIAVAAISVLTKRKRFWIGSLLFGTAGTVFLILGLLVR
jgi:hypothetical protein